MCTFAYEQEPLLVICNYVVSYTFHKTKRILKNHLHFWNILHNECINKYIK